MKLISKNDKETQKIAADFAKQLRGGEVILLFGDLGAGKTVFVKGLAKALGVREVVKSPTFNLLKLYRIPTTYNLQPTTYFCHIDAYRLKNFDDLSDIGAEEYIGKKNVITVIEWAERIGESDNNNDYNYDRKTKKQENKKMELVRKIIKIKISHGEKDTERIIEIEN